MKTLSCLLTVILCLMFKSTVGQDNQCRTLEMDSATFINTPYYGNNQYLLDLLSDLDINFESSNKVFNEEVLFRIPIKLWVHRNGSEGGIDLDRILDMITTLNEIQINNVTQFARI